MPKKYKPKAWIKPSAQEWAERQRELLKRNAFAGPEKRAALDQLLEDDRARPAFEKAAIFSPNHPEEGQILLMEAVIEGLDSMTARKLRRRKTKQGSRKPESTKLYFESATRQEAEAWRSDFLEKLDDLQSLWEVKPRNIGPLEEFRVALLGNTHNPIDRDLLENNDRFSYQISSILMSRGLYILQSAVETTPYKSRGYAAQVRSEGAARRRFVRHLNSKLAAITGQKEIRILNDLATIVFGRELEDREIRRYLED